MDGHPAEGNEGIRPRGNNRRAAVLDAAAYRFRRQGYAATTMRDIAADAGMLAGSLYYHFPSNLLNHLLKDLATSLPTIYHKQNCVFYIYKMLDHQNQVFFLI